MMAVGLTSGALLLVMLIGTSYSLPVKTGGDGSSSGGGGSSANPGSAPGWQAPSGGYVSVGSGSRPVSNPAAAAYSSYYPAAPAQYSSVFVSGSAHPQGGYPQGGYPQGAPQAYSWGVDPVEPLSVEKASPARAPSDFGDSDSSYGPMPWIPSPAYQAGELSHVEKTYEHGNSDSESEDQGRPPYGPGPYPPPGDRIVYPLGGDPAAYSVQSGPGLYPLPGGPGFGWPWYPYYDYQFLTGQYPPGTVSHFSTSYEQGRDHYNDNHYIRDLPTSPSDPQLPGQQHKQQFGSLYGRS